MMSHACESPLSFRAPAPAPWWRQVLSAWARRRDARALQHAARHVDEALADLPIHVLRDIGAPESLIAHVASCDARACVDDALAVSGR
jgi:hypothetical protein